MNMYPHTITIYRHCIENGRDIYTKHILKGVYFRNGTVAAKSGNGFEKSCETVISVRPELSRTFNETWNVTIGDKIVLGIGREISSFKELQNFVTVKTVSENICGSPLDGVVIKCG